MRLHTFFVTVLLCALALLPLPDARAEKPYRVAGDDSFPPYEFVDMDGSFKGFNIDLMNAISLFTDIKFEFYPMQWEKAYAAAESGTVDIIQGLKVTEGRKQRFAFTDTLVKNTDSIFVRTGTVDINSLADLSGKRVGADYLDIREDGLSGIKGIEIIIYRNPETALMALHSGQIDALICNMLVVNYLSNKHNIASEIMVVGRAFNEQDYAIAVTNGNQALLEQLNAGIRAVQASGVYDRLYRKWFGVPIGSRQENIRLAVSVTLGAVLLIFMIIYVYNRINRQLKLVIEAETAKQKTAMEKLREYDKLQFMDRIISSIAHEIRNPLTAIRFYAEQIPQKIGNPAFMAAVAEDIPSEIERIDALIKEFIEYTTPRRADRESIRLREFLDQVLSFVHVQLKNIHVRLDVADSLSVLFDRNHLRQILLNVLINSIDALRETQSPAITIAAFSHEKKVMLSIRDNGGGADEDAMQYLFDPFYTRKAGGNGLGLFVVRQMAEENGGRVEARNDNGGMLIVLTVEGGE